MTLREFSGVIQLYWKTFLAVTMAVVVAGLTWLALTPPQYVSTARLLVSVQGSSATNAYQNDGVVLGRVHSYIALITTDVVTRRVIDKLGLNLTPPQLGAKISAVNVPPNTALIDIAVTDPNRDQARRITDTVAAEFVGYANALETATGTDAQRVRTTVVSPATEPRRRLAERIGLAALISALAVLIGAMAVWIRSITDPVLRNPRQAAAAVGAPVLGHIGAGGADQYLVLRTGIRRSAGAHGLRMLQMSPIDDAAATHTIALNLAAAMTTDGSRWVVIDASDTPPPDSPDSNEHVIVTTPPVLDGVTASATSEYADGVLLIGATGYTARRDAERAAAGLRAAGAVVLGVALESDDRGRSRRER